MNDLASAVAYAIFAALVAFLSRIGIVRRVKNIEREIEVLRSDHQTAQTNMKRRMEQSRMEFRTEVENLLAPVGAKLDSMDSTLGQLTTMVSSMVNKVGDEPINSKQPESRTE